MATTPSTLVTTQARESLADRLHLLERCEQMLRQHGQPNPAIRGVVPGRIEVLGKHVDYAGGRSIVCAVDRGFVFAAETRRDNVVRVIDALTGDSRETVLADDHRDHSRDWGAYVATVARRLTRDAPTRLLGVDLAFASDLPRASGLSSSSALIIATFLALAQANGWFTGADLGELLQRMAPLQLADYLAAVESGRPFATLAGDTGVGTLGGSQDHAAILFAHQDHLSRFAYLPTTFLGECALPHDLTIAVAFSGVHAEKIGAVRELYNKASMTAGEIVRLWYEATGDTAVHALRDFRASSELAAARDVLRHRPSSHFTAVELLERLEHFLLEERLHDSAVAALTQQDWHRFGSVVAESQRGAEELLGNQIAETSYLARTAREGGALAASAFGAGFGGSVWALIQRREAPVFLATWKHAYVQSFPESATRATFFTSRPSAAAHFIA